MWNNVEQVEKCGQVELLGFSTNKFTIYCTAVVFYVRFAQNKGAGVFSNYVSVLDKETCDWKINSKVRTAFVCSGDIQFGPKIIFSLPTM